MTFAHTAQQRSELNQKATALLTNYPNVGSFIRQGLSINPDAGALVFLRTALDSTPVITKAGDALGLLHAARRWLRRNGIGPDDVISLLAPNCTATSYCLLGSNGRSRPAAAKSSVYSRGDRRTGQRSQGQNAVGPTARRARGVI